MYFQKIQANDWSLQKALEEYMIEYGVEKGTFQMHLDLKAIIDDPNRLTSAKDKARVLLDSIDSSFGNESIEEVTETSQTLDLISSRNDTDSIHMNRGEVSTFNESDHCSDNISSSCNVTNKSEAKKRKSTDKHYSKSAKFISKVNGVSESVQDSLIVKKDDGTYFNLSSKFEAYYKNSLDIYKQRQMFLEADPFGVLALSSVLLIKPNQYPENLLEYIDIEELDSTRHRVLCKLICEDYEDVGFDIKLKLQVIGIIKQYMKRNGNKLKCIKSLTSLLDSLCPDESNIILSLINYVKVLPDARMNYELDIVELCSSYLNPVLFNLFHSDGNSRLRWINNGMTLPAESNEELFVERHPEAIISSVKQNIYTEIKGYGEVKTEADKENTYLLTRDLIRLGVFSKQSIDHDNMKAVINFQAIGSSIYFYLNSLIGDGIYSFVEFAHIDAPMTKMDLLSYVNQFDTLMLIAVAYKNSCVPLVKDSIPAKWKRRTMDSQTFKTYINGSIYNDALMKLADGAESST